MELLQSEEYIYDQVPIKDIQPGDEIQSLDEKTGQLVWSRVNALMDMGVKEIYKLTTQSGKTIRTTANHPYFTQKGWKKVAYLKEGMEIAVSELPLLFSDQNNQRKGNNNQSAEDIKIGHNISNIVHNYYYLIADKLNSQQAKDKINLVSSRLYSNLSNSDMSVQPIKNRSVFANTEAVDFSFSAADRIGKMKRLASGDVEFNLFNNSLLSLYRKFAELLVSVFGETITNHKLSRRSIDFEDTIPDFLDFSISSQNAGEEYSKSSNSSSVDSLSKKSPYVWPLLSIILNTPFSRSLNEEGTFDKGNNFSLSSNSAIYSQYTNVETDVKWDKITSIERVGQEQVYDIEVEGTHNFIGNDIVAHNTYISGAATTTKSMYIGGTASTTELFVQGAGHIGGNLTIDGSATTSKSFYIGNDLTVNSGRVGIGTTTPNSFLQVVRSSGGTETLFKVGSSTDDDLLEVRSNGNVLINTGNVGIGTTSPLAKLDVYGDAIISGANRYLNFGATSGTNGYGLRDTSGQIQFKHSGGAWADIGSGTGGGAAWEYSSPLDAMITTSTKGIFLTASSSIQANFRIDGSATTTKSMFIGGTASTTELFVQGAGHIGGNLTIDGSATTSKSFYIANDLTVMNGNVGIGTTTPNEILSISGNKNVSQISMAFTPEANGDYTGIKVTRPNTTLGEIRITNNANLGGGIDFLVHDDDNNAATVPAVKMTIDPNGNVGIGTTTPSGKLHVAGVIDMSPIGDVGAAGIDGVRIQTSGGSTYIDNHGGSTYFRTGAGAGEVSSARTTLSFDNSNGNVTIGTLGTGANYYVCASAAGLLSEATTCSGSSLRYKTNVADLGLGLETLKQLRPVTFNWKTDYRPEEQGGQLGFIAEEMEQINPMFVTYKDGQIHGVKYDQMAALLTKSILELNAKVDLRNAVFDLTGAGTSSPSVLSLFNSTSTPAMVIDANGNIGIATTTPTNILTIGQGKGDAIADGWSVYSSRDYKTDITYLEEREYDDILEEIKGMKVARYRWKSDTGAAPMEQFSPRTAPLELLQSNTNLGLIAEEAPKDVLSPGGRSVSLYDYTSFIAAGLKSLALEVEELKAELATGLLRSPDGSLAMTQESDGQLLMVDTSELLRQQLAGLGLVIDETGALVVEKIKAKDLEIVSGGQITLPEGQGEVMGDGEVTALSKYAIIANSKVKNNSKIFVTFTSNLGGNNWWICDKKESESFTICLTQATDNLLTFDYWIVQGKISVDASGTDDSGVALSTTTSEWTIDLNSEPEEATSTPVISSETTSETSSTTDSAGDSVKLEEPRS
ncbi:MAG: hypothetical protein A3I88_00985 [Candidatus Portnoybacteria bacterium RIFCSPLOWO2_12_FULL_39_9]|nr:MAG: hypothetical protein A3I88_00985 [Candidatus Portnoybacteria bacterium RIFCSPLOWO2_12_FULL_39_9]